MQKKNFDMNILREEAVGDTTVNVEINLILKFVL
jgi:hypothetical protein